MTIEKLPSGSYRIKRMIKGKLYSLTLSYKPSKREAEELIRGLIDQAQNPQCYLTFEQGAEQYIDMKRNVLSPSTIREYGQTCNRLPKWFISMKICDIDQIVINKCINELSINRSPKTVRNYHGFISSILRLYNPQMVICTTLPQKVHSEPYIPSDSDIRAILAASKGTQYDIPLKLACYGLRRSEICALKYPDDFSGRQIYIHHALVMDENKEWVLKNTKTTESERYITISKELLKQISNQGYVYSGHPNAICDWLTDTQQSLGLPHFSLHKFRHYFASKTSEVLPDAEVIKLGGWKTDSVMKSVYRHAMSKDDSCQKIASDILDKAIFRG